jgi:AcrR family transcriptional regulator
VETGDAEADALADARRTQIVEVTWRLIATEGLEAATMRRIAEGARCTTGLVTHYFASKEDLLLASLQRITDRSGTRMRVRRSRGLDRLREVAEAVLPLDEERSLEWRVWLAFWGRAYSNDHLLREQRERYERWRSAVRRAVAEAVESGDLVGDDVEREVSRFVGLLMGLSIDAINRGVDGEGSGLLDLVEHHIAAMSRVGSA